MTRKLNAIDRRRFALIIEKASLKELYALELELEKEIRLGESAKKEGFNN